VILAAREAEYFSAEGWTLICPDEANEIGDHVASDAPAACGIAGHNESKVRCRIDLNQPFMTGPIGIDATCASADTFQLC
jgi:hypothetical protein